MSSRVARVVLHVDATRVVRELERARESIDRFRRVWLNTWTTTRRVRRSSGPAPLTIDGHEYRRRRRARARRRA